MELVNVDTISIPSTQYPTTPSGWMGFSLEFLGKFDPKGFQSGLDQVTVPANPLPLFFAHQTIA